MKLFTILSVFVILFVAFKTSAKDEIPNMLDNALKGVVIVAAPENDNIETPRPFGIASSGKNEYENNWIFEGIGSSGFVISMNDKLYVITNVHVIQGYYTGDKTIFVYSINGNKYKTEIVGGDDFSDVGVLKFIDKPGDDIKPLVFRDDDDILRVGEEVYAIGHPMLKTGNHQYTVTNGIVSAKNRRMGSATGRFGMIQHTASLLYGNSGGPLIDAEGKIIGINTSIGREDVGAFDTFSGSTQVNIPVFYMNYSVENPIIKRVINDVIQFGRIKRAFLGLELTQVFSTFTKVIRIKITGLIDNSIGSKNFEVDDILQKVNGKNISNIDDALEAFEMIKPEDDLELEILRNGESKKVSLKTDALTDNNLESIAKFCISRQTKYKIDVKDGNIIFEANDITKTQFPVYFAGSGAYIRSVKNLSDLGKIIRITSIDGKINILSNDNIYLPGPSDDHEIYLGGGYFNLKHILYY